MIYVELIFTQVITDAIVEYNQLVKVDSGSSVLHRLLAIFLRDTMHFNVVPIRRAASSALPAPPSIAPVDPGALDQ